MKAWAIVIGRKHSKRYIARSNNGPELMVYATRDHARRMRRLILKTCGYNDVFVIPLQTKGD